MTRFYTIGRRNWITKIKTGDENPVYLVRVNVNFQDVNKCLSTRGGPLKWPRVRTYVQSRVIDVHDSLKGSGCHEIVHRFVYPQRGGEEQIDVHKSVPILCMVCR